MIHLKRSYTLSEAFYVPNQITSTAKSLSTRQLFYFLLKDLCMPERIQVV